MHLQIRSKVPSGQNGPGAMSITEGAEGVSVVQPGRLLKLLDLLAEDQRSRGDRHGPFSLRAASGTNIETTGRFVFSVVAPDDDDEAEEAEHHAALKRIQGEFPDSKIVHRAHAHLEHRAGALRDYVAEFAGRGELIDEIVIGVSDTDGGKTTVPVQVHALKTID
jgi:hypothetical protein